MKNKKVVSALLVAVMSLSLMACGAKESTENTEENTGELKKISVSMSPDMVDITELVKEPLAELGYELDEEVFDDFVMPNQALQEGSVDCNWFQHEPYMEVFNENQGTEFVMVTPKVLATPYGVYSDKIESLDDVEDGMTVAISDEPSNRSRSLLILQEAGLITLAENPIDEYYAAADIVENPHNLEVKEGDYYALYSIMSEYGFIIVPCSFVDQAGGDATTAIYREKDTTYAMGIVVNAGDENAEWAKAFNDALHSEAFKAAVEENYPGIYAFVE